MGKGVRWILITLLFASACGTDAASPSEGSTAPAPQTGATGGTAPVTEATDGGGAGVTGPEEGSDGGTDADPGARYYGCAALLSDAEAQAATGLSDAALFNTDPADQREGSGQTYCQFFADEGGISLALSVFTGPSYRQGFEPLAQAAQAGGAEEISGLGDAAGWSGEGNPTLGIRVGELGITIVFADMSGTSLAKIEDVRGAAVAMGELVASRV